MNNHDTHFACNARLTVDGGDTKCCSCEPHSPCELNVGDSKTLEPDDIMTTTFEEDSAMAYEGIKKHNHTPWPEYAEALTLAGHKIKYVTETIQNLSESWNCPGCKEESKS